MNVAWLFNQFLSESLTETAIRRNRRPDRVLNSLTLAAIAGSSGEPVRTLVWIGTITPESPLTR